MRKFAVMAAVAAAMVLGGASTASAAPAPVKPQSSDWGGGGGAWGNIKCPWWSYPTQTWDGTWYCQPYFGRQW